MHVINGSKNQEVSRRCTLFFFFFLKVRVAGVRFCLSCMCVPVFVMRDAPAVCESLADFNASLIPLLARYTVPAIEFPKSEKPNKLLPANALLSPMQITPQCALIVREAGTWSRWISHCQSITNWICHIMLCQLFPRIHLTDKTIIKLMQCSQQSSLVV